MGGCASKPKELTETNPDAAPVEEPVKAEETVAAKAETTADDQKDSSGSDDKSKDEAPLVDLSKPDEDEKKETKAAEAVPVLVLPGESIVVENPKGETVEVEVAAKEGEIIYVEAVKETKKEEEEEKEKKEAQEEPKTAPPATSEDKKEELLVKV